MTASRPFDTSAGKKTRRRQTVGLTSRRNPTETNGDRRGDRRRRRRCFFSLLIQIAVGKLRELRYTRAPRSFSTWRWQRFSRGIPCHVRRVNAPLERQKISVRVWKRPRFNEIKRAGDSANEKYFNPGFAPCTRLRCLRLRRSLVVLPEVAAEPSRILIPTCFRFHGVVVGQREGPVARRKTAGTTVTDRDDPPAARSLHLPPL